MMKLTGDIRRDFEKISAEYTQLKGRILEYQETNKEPRRFLDKARESKSIQKTDYEQRLAEKDAIIKELTNRLEHELALKGHDGTNTGIPTSQTPVGKKKIIPNSRVVTGKKKGGQPGHERHMLEAPPDEEIDIVIAHELSGEECCPGCHGQNHAFSGEHESKYEIDIQVNVVKTRHEYYIYECTDCGENFRTGIAPNLRAQCQYGPMTQAAALSLMNTANAPINKARTFISGLTGGQAEPCEGYIAKLQHRAASALDAFMEGLRLMLITRVLVYWDETVIMINKQRACLRFYGDESIAYYTAHLHKDMQGLDDDNVLALLTAETSVMHDHNKVNYNEKYCFQNLECNQHLQRDLQKSADDTRHPDLLELKELISKTIKDRKDLIAAGADAFGDIYTANFENRLQGILVRAEKANTEDFNSYSGQFEKNLIKRVRKYNDNYFAWVYDFSLPTTDNLSERALRCIKSRMKISGQFQSEKTARYFAKIKSYIETCRRNGINEIHALTRLCEGNPYTVMEIFSPVST
jgi:hypothetical protein